MYHNFFIHSSVDEATLRRLQGQRRSTNKTVRGAKLCLESNPKPARDIERKKLRSSNKPCAHQDAETPQRLSQNCVWVSPVKVWVNSGLLQGQGLWIQQTWVWHKPFWGRSPLTPPESCQNLHRTGKQTLGGHKQNLVCTKTQEKRAAAIPARDLLRGKLGLVLMGRAVLNKSLIQFFVDGWSWVSSLLFTRAKLWWR